MIYLGVNIDHVATVRQARLSDSPDPVYAAYLAELGGADGITIHLREDRRHIQDRDLELLSKTVKTRINLEMACTDEMIDIAIKHKPATCCIVPEKRQELTTEGGLDVIKHEKQIKSAIEILHENNIKVSLFIDPDDIQIEMSSKLNADFVELHTGTYADASNKDKQKELKRLYKAAELANNLDLIVNAGHGLDYNNIYPVLLLKNLNEVNIGHSIIARSIYTGLEKAVRDMKDIISKYYTR
jgi:pyridoxine 5-phosphate synthase